MEDGNGDGQTARKAGPARLPTLTFRKASSLEHPGQHSNIILLRGARSENGQIILQNRQDLLSLLNDETNKPIVLQQAKLKTTPSSNSERRGSDAKAGPHQSSGAILIQAPIQNGQLDAGTVFLQSSKTKKNVFLRQKADHPASGTAVTTNAGVSTGVPFLLQTLKRLDNKTQSIFVFRNPTPSTTTSTTPADNGITPASAGSTSTSTLSKVTNISGSTLTFTAATSQIGGGGAGIGLKTNKLLKSATIARMNSISTQKSTQNNSPGSGNNASNNNHNRNVLIADNNGSVGLDAVQNLSDSGQQQKQMNVPLGADGEPIKLPENLESLPRADHFPSQRHRWNTNEEIAAILISFDKHSEWQSKEVKTRPKSGSLLLYSRKKVRYRRDGYCWKKRKDGKTTREDHMKLKVQGTECIYGCYVHSAILPTFHRRCYWLLQNPDIVLVHYLNVPYPDDNKMAVITPSLALWGDKKEWTKEELVSQLKPMFFSEDDSDSGNDIEISTAETVDTIVSQLMEKQRMARQAALVKQLECGCSDANCIDGKSCTHPMRRMGSLKTMAIKRQDASLSNGMPQNGQLVSPRIYSRWVDRRKDDGTIKFQVINNNSNNPSNVVNHHFQVQAQTQQSMNRPLPMGQQLQGDQFMAVSTGAPISNSNQIFTNASNQLGNQLSRIANPNIMNSNHNINSIAATTTAITTTALTYRKSTVASVTSATANHIIDNNSNNRQSNNQLSAHSHIPALSHHSHPHPHTQAAVQTQNQNPNQPQSLSQQQISLQNSNDSNLNNLSNHNNQQSTSAPASTSSSVEEPNGHQQRAASVSISMSTQKHHPQALHSRQQQQQQAIIDSNAVNQRVSSSGDSSTDIGPTPTTTATSSASSVVINLSQQLHNAGSSLIVLNSGQQPQQQSFSCQQSNVSKDEQLSGNKQISPTNYASLSYNSSNVMLESSPIQQKNRHMTKDLSDSLSFFNETLDLSHEDIQKTLIANMPLSANAAHSNRADGGDMSHMDFIDNVSAVTGQTSVTNGHDSDDVFVNLDAFDMLVEFPELEFEAKNSFGHIAYDDHKTVPGPSDGVEGANQIQCFNISDYSPEWAYPEGGIKVLVTGPWKASSTYTVLFDSFPVATTVVQEGVLRCYCPAHEVGLVSLQVACDDFVISNSVMFEYKSPPNVEAACEGTVNDCLYKFTLLNRLSTIDDHMQIKAEPKDLSEQAELLTQPNFEERLVNYCQLLSNKTWRSMTPGAWSVGYRGMTLLHLASALGYSRLVRSMLTWRSENPNVILETEIDALSRDVQGFTPLTWACVRGHLDTAKILYKWSHNSLKVKNNFEQTPLDVARVKGFVKLVTELQQLEADRIKRDDRTISEFVATRFSPEESDSKVTDSDSNSRSHDGVFLRPGAVWSSPSPSSGMRFVKRTSIDSGINMDMRTMPRAGKVFKEQALKYQGSYDSVENNSLSVDSGNGENSNSSSLLSPMRKMDFALCEVSAASPFMWDVQKRRSSSDDEDNSDSSNVNDSEVAVGESDAKVLTLAEHIIAAMPERIKIESEEMMILGSPMSESLNTDTSEIADTFMDPILDSLPSTQFDSDFSFEFSDQSYRYNDVSTPCSSLSPASSGPLQSPASYTMPLDPPMGTPSPPPSTKELTEFLLASSNSQRPFEADFSKLTLTDSEQRELYEAAKCIQKAYRSYKGRKKLEEQDKERSAAIVIQNYYRRYKQYAYFRQMTHAALVIQNGYRSYCENKRVKKSQMENMSLLKDNQDSQCLKNYYDHYQNDKQQAHHMSSVKEASGPSGPLKRTYSQRTQNQAARKIQQFMRQSKLKLQKERAEKEKLVHQRKGEYLRNCLHHGQCAPTRHQERNET